MNYELNLAIYLATTVIGAVVSSYLGYLEAKKIDPTIVFDWVRFYESMLRSLPGIVAASAAFAASGLTVQSLIAAFVAGAGMDVVLKRIWRATKKPKEDGGG